MDPVYSRDECVAAMRDYYAFLAYMFMDPPYIIEPPQDGWPNITPEATQGLGKTDEVIELLRHLPYIVSKPYSNVPEGLPDGTFIDWKHIIERLNDGKAHAENELLGSEGVEDRFGGKIPARCIGLVHGGLLLNYQDPDVILLDTKYGIIYWMNCPDKIMETASPQPSYLVYPLDGEVIETKEDESDDNENKHDAEGYDKEKDEVNESKGKDENKDEDEDQEEDEEEDEDDSEDDGDDGIEWGPCWPIAHFFEMLKNQYRQLNFMARNAHDVFDIWTDTTAFGTPIPEDFKDTIQGIYRKYGWPDINQYQKDRCLAEIKIVLDKRFPEHHDYYSRSLT